MISSEYRASAPDYPDEDSSEHPPHKGKIMSNGHTMSPSASTSAFFGGGCHPGEPVISFSKPVQSADYSNRSSASPPPPPNEVVHHSSLEKHSFLFPNNNQTITFSNESEKYLKLKRGKERKAERKKGKNFKSEYVMPDNGEGAKNYELEEVLKSLGELEKTAEKKTKQKTSQRKKSKDSTTTKNGHSKTTDNSSADDETNKSEEEEEGSDEPIVETKTKKIKDKNNKKSTEFENVKTSLLATTKMINVVSEKEDHMINGELMRQISRSTENLSSFTKVTTKKKWKRKTNPSNEEGVNSSSSSSNSNNINNNNNYNNNNNDRRYEGRRSASGYNLRNRPTQQDFNSSSRTDSSRSSSTSRSEQSPSVLTVASGHGSSSSVSQLKQHVRPEKQPQKPEPYLDLSADFPPLNSSEDSDQLSNTKMNTNMDVVKKTWGPQHPIQHFESVPSSDSPAVIQKIDTVDPLSASLLPPPPLNDSFVAAHVAEKELQEQNNNAIVPNNVHQAVVEQPPDITRNNVISTMSSLPDIASQAPLEGAVGSSGENTPTNSINNNNNSNNQAPTSESGASSRDLSSRNSTASFFLDTENNVDIVKSEEEYNKRGGNVAPVVIFGKGDSALNDWSDRSEIEFGFDLNENLLLSSTTQAHHLPLLPVSSDFNNMLLDNAIVSLGHPVQHEDQGADANDDGDDILSGRSTPKVVEAVKAAEPEFGEADIANYIKIIGFVSTRWKIVESEMKKKARNVVVYKASCKAQVK